MSNGYIFGNEELAIAREAVIPHLAAQARSKGNMEPIYHSGQSIFGGGEQPKCGPPSALIYDCEILNCIPQKDEETLPGINYCAGWHDYPGMGISCVGTYDFLDNRYRIFTEESLGELKELMQNREHIIGFNSKTFDDPLLAAHGIAVNTTWDLLEKIREAMSSISHLRKGMGRPSYKLDVLAKSNNLPGKEMEGGLAPVMWQRGHRYKVIEYCLGDIVRTRLLFELQAIKCPLSGIPVAMPKPFGLNIVR